MNRSIILFSFMLLISCDEETEQFLGPDGMPLENPDQTFLYFTVEDEDNLIFSVNVFNLQPVSAISFAVFYDSTVFTINSNGVVSSSDFTPSVEYGPYFSSNNVSFWYEFSNSVSGDGVLATLDLELLSGGSIQGTDIEFGEIIFLGWSWSIRLCLLIFSCLI